MTDKYKVGMKVAVEGIVTGEIGEISDGCMYVWQNETCGAVGYIHPCEKDYTYSWRISLDTSLKIQILSSPRQSWLEIYG